MNFQVCNRNNVADTARYLNANGISNVIISIYDSDKSPVYIYRNNIPCTKAILPVMFDDIDKSVYGLIQITSKDGENIARFINRYKQQVDVIIVQCEAGQSRSAGCCAAIMRYLTGNDSDIFDNPRYTPNMLVYRTVLNALVKFEEEYVNGT